MPCYQPDAYDLENMDRLLGAEAEVQSAMSDYNKLVQITCAACKELESRGVEIPTEDLRAWWKEHQKSPGHEK